MSSARLLSPGAAPSGGDYRLGLIITPLAVLIVAVVGLALLTVPS